MFNVAFGHCHSARQRESRGRHAYAIDEFESQLTIKKSTIPGGGTDFPFTIDPGTYQFLDKPFGEE